MTFTDWFPHDLKPTSGQNSPYFVELQGGKTYNWCSCGNSKTQPFCDGKHKGTGFKPIQFKGAGTYMLCGCKCAVRCSFYARSPLFRRPQSGLKV
jgi:hypothetical protein